VIAHLTVLAAQHERIAATGPMVTAHMMIDAVRAALQHVLEVSHLRELRAW